MTSDGEAIDWRRHFFVVVRGLWLVILLTLVSVGAAWFWLQRQVPQYNSRAVLRVEEQEVKVLDKVENVREEALQSITYMNTIVQSLTSNTLLLRVITANGLDKDPWIGYPSKGGKPPLEVELAERFKTQITVKPRRTTRLIDIVVEHPNPEMARKLANSIVSEFLASTIEQRKGLASNATGFLSGEFEQLRKKVQDSEARLARFRSENKDAISVVDQQNIIVERLKALNADVTNADNALIKLETDLQQLERVKEGNFSELLNIPSVAALPVIAQAREALAAKESQFAALKNRYLEKHPKHIEAATQVTELRKSLELKLKSADSLLRQRFDAAKETQRRLHAALEEQKKKALALDQLAMPYNALAREVELDRQLFQEVSSRRRETQLSEKMDRVPYTLVEAPLVANTPVKPQKLKTLAIALFGGLLAGLGVVLGLDRLDSSLRSVDQAEHELGLGALAALPDAGKGKDGSSGLVMLDDGGSSAAEAFRTLRASLSLLGEESTRRLLLVTSAVPAEGKTYTSVNLAIALAKQGYRTLLVDADLRQPQVANVLLGKVQKRHELPGLSDVLSGEASLDQSVRPTEIENLFVLIAGRRAPNPAELLAQPHAGRLLQSLPNHFDRVVVDSAPVNAVSDSLALAGHVHAVCLVVRAGKTPRRAVERAVKQLQTTGARIAGFVLNRVPRGRGAAYYYYYYGDTYVKDGVYGAEPMQNAKTLKS